MSNEDKILDLLTSMQKDMKKMQADIDSLKNHRETDDHKLDDEGIKKQLAVAENLRNLLTEEEVNALAVAVGE